MEGAVEGAKDVALDVLEAPSDYASGRCCSDEIASTLVLRAVLPVLVDVTLDRHGSKVQD